MGDSMQGCARGYVHRGIGFHITTDQNQGGHWRAYVLIAGLRAPIGSELGPFEQETAARGAAVDFALKAIDHLIDRDLKYTRAARRTADPYLAAAAELLGFDQRFS